MGIAGPIFGDGLQESVKPVLSGPISAWDAQVPKAQARAIGQKNAPTHPSHGRARMELMPPRDIRWSQIDFQARLSNDGDISLQHGEPHETGELLASPA
jgi:hypothetical protein